MGDPSSGGSVRVNTLLKDPYSTTETVTGGVWIDGKAIYRKVVALSTKPNLSQVNNAHGITGIASKIKIWAHFNDGAYFNSFDSSQNTSAGEESVFFEDTNVAWNSGFNRTAVTDAYAILEYTKT